MREVLHLKDEYIKEVKVKIDDSIFAGTLTLTPDICSIEIFTERSITFDVRKIKFLECGGMIQNQSYLLYGLELLHYRSSSLQIHKQGNINYNNLKLKIKFAIFIDGNMPRENKEIHGFTIISDFIKKWTMHTKTQSELLNKSTETQDIRNLAGNEFIQEIRHYGNLGIYYLPMTFTSLQDLNYGVKIRPQLTINFENNISFENIYEEYLKLYRLLTVFNGTDFSVDFIEVYTKSVYNTTASLYFTTSKTNEELNFTLLPLGKDIIMSFYEFKQLPLDFFDIYYNLSDEKLELFKRYLKYKQLNSIEDKFLGYFRLLEKLTFKKEPYVDKELLESLLERAKAFVAIKLNTKNKTVKALNQRILHMNQSKLNTEKCIGDFFDRIPEEILHTLKYSKTDLNTICKLRNDITHANDYIVTDFDLYKYTEFINSLLFLAFINILLEIPLETCIPIANRLQRIY